jgi:hypothetical protein
MGLLSVASFDCHVMAVTPVLLVVPRTADSASYTRVGRGTTFIEREICQEFWIEKGRGRGGYFGLIVSVTVPEFICTSVFPQRE